MSDNILTFEGYGCGGGYPKYLVCSGRKAIMRATKEEARGLARQWRSYSVCYPKGSPYYKKGRVKPRIFKVYQWPHKCKGKNYPNTYWWPIPIKPIKSGFRPEKNGKNKIPF
jgi:hypothetical protein